MIRLLLTAFLFLTTITTYAQSDLVVFSTNPTNEYEGGELLTFTIMVTNNGPSPALNVHTFYAIPPGLLPIPNGIVRFWWTGSNGTSGTNVPVNSTIASLGVNQTVSYTINIQISSTFTDTLDDAIVTYDTLSDIEVVNTNGQTNYVPGTQSVYTITVTNNGPEDATNVEIFNDIPAGITNFSWVGDNGSSGTNAPLDNVIASLPVGSTATYTVALDVPVGFTNPIVSTVDYFGVNDPNPVCDQCTDTDYPSVGTDIVIVNTNGQEVYTPGSPSVYTVTVANNGTVAAANVNAFFTVPASVTNVTWTGSNGSSGTQANLTDNIGTLNVGQTITYTLTVDVPAGFTGNFVVNASATTSTPETDGTCEFCTDTDYEAASADIVVVNTNNQNVYTAGTTSVYTVTVSNNGPTAAANVQVDNAIPAGITNFSWVGDNGSSGVNTALSDAIASLPVGAVVTYTITLDIPVGYTGLLTSETTVTSSTPDPDPSCNACVDTDSDAASADLVVTKTLASGTTYTAGLDAVYTITIENMGPTEAQNVDVSDIIPAGIDPTTVTWSGSNGTSGTGNLTDNIASIAVGEVVSYQLVMPIPSNFDQTANIVNQVQVSSSTPDPNPACPDCTHTATPNPLANLVTVKTNGQSTYVAGTQTIYTITVTNPGPSDAYNVVVHDNKPYQIVLMSWTGNGTSGSGTMHNTIPVLAAGESMTYEVSIEIPDDYHQTVGPLQNIVAVTSDTPDPIPTCTTCTDIDQPSSNFLTVTQNKYTVEELVRDVLIGVDCVEISNITWSSGPNFGQDDNGIGYFEGNNSDFPIQSGLILQSGNALEAGGPNMGPFDTPPGDGILGGGNWPGDGQLLTYMQGLGFSVTDYNDASIIEFDFVPISSHMSFNFLFASEEYGTWQCSFADAFAFFLNDITTSGPVTNLAVVPGTTTPVSVVSIRDQANNGNCNSSNVQYFGQYNDNPPTNATSAIDFKGQTVVMVAESDVVPGDTYHIKLVIADRNDNALDSAVFLEAGSFNIGQPVLPDDLTLANGGALCPEDSYVITASNTEDASFTYQWEKDGVLMLDEFGQPITTETITVTEPGIYTILASFVSNPGCQLEDSIRIEFQPNIEFNDPVDLNQCGDVTDTMVFDLTQNTTTITEGHSVLYDLIYFESMEDLVEGNPIFTPSTYEATNGQEIYVALIPYLNGCIITRSFTLNIIDCEVPLPELDPIAVCEPAPYDGAEIFDLTIYEDQLVENLTDPTQYTISYYENEADADAAVPVPGTEITDPTAFSSISGTVYIRVQYNTLAEAYNTTELELIVNPEPEVVLPAGPYEACVDTGYTLPALTLGSYFTGTQGTGTQMNAGDVIFTSQTIYVYVITGTAPYTCDDEDSFDVIINPLPAPPAPLVDYVLCDQTNYQNPDGVEEFDLTSKDMEITGGNPDYVVSYYTDPNDAETATSPITNPTTYTNSTAGAETIYVRLDNTVTTCYDVFDFDLVVTPLPLYSDAAREFHECEEVPGQADFDLHSHDSDLSMSANGVTVSYYGSRNEAEVGDPSTQLPDIYVAPDAAVIYARLQSSITGCWTVVQINLHVDSAPIAPALTALEECDFNLDNVAIFDIQSVLDYIETQLGDVVATAHETQADAEFGTNAITNTGAYPNIEGLTDASGIQTVYIRVSSAFTVCYDMEELQLIVHPVPVATEPAPYALCDNGPDDTDGEGIFVLPSRESEILGGLDPSLYTVGYFATFEDAEANTPAITNPGSYTASTALGNTTVYVRVTNNATGCYDIVALELIINPLPVATQPTPYTLCDVNTIGGQPDEVEEFDLTTKIPEIIGLQTGINVTFHHTLADADANVNEIQNPESYSNQSNAEAIYVRVTFEATGCYRIVLLDVRVEPLPVIVPPSQEDLTVCDPDSDGQAQFNLDALVADMINNGENLSVTFHETAQDAEEGINAIPNTDNYTNPNAYNQVIYVRVENTVTGCYTATAYALNLIVVDTPQIDADLADITLCDTDNNDQDGIMAVDLTAQDAYILEHLGNADPSDYIIHYFNDPVDAQNGAPRITNPTAYGAQDGEVIYVRIEDVATGCYSIETFTVYVNIPLALTRPPVLSVCNEALPNDMTAEFDLTVMENTILGPFGVGLGYTVNYYEPGATTPIADPAHYVNTSNPMTLTVEVITLAGCSSTTTMTIKVLPLPTPNTSPDALVLCDDNNAGDGQEEFDLTLAAGDIMDNEPNLILSYHLTYEDADQDTNAIADPAHFVSGTATVYVRVEANTGNPNDAVCYQIVELDLIVNPLPALGDNGAVPAYAICEQNTDGFATFILSSHIPEILGADADPDDYLVRFYFDQAALDAGTALPNQYNNISTPQDILVWVQHIESGCTTTAPMQLLVEEAAVANAPADPVLSTCDDDGDNDGMHAFDLSVFDAEILGTQDPADYSVAYYESFEDADTATNPIADPALYVNTTADVMTIYARVTNTSTISGCHDITEITLIVERLPEPVITSVDGSNTICVDYITKAVLRTVTLDSGIPAGMGYSFVWYLDGVELTGYDPASPTYEASVEGNYTVEVTGPAPLNCISDISAAFEVLQSGPASPVGPGYEVTNYFSDNQVITVYVEGYGEYEYKLDEDGMWQTSNVFTNVPAGTHTVYVRDVSTEFACDEIAIEGVSLVDYPHYFTPNGDGYHDTWNIIGLNQPDAKVYIFDRYGKLIKQISATEESEGWDGTYNGSPLPATDYWFTVTYHETVNGLPVVKEFKAHFSLKR